VTAWRWAYELQHGRPIPPGVLWECLSTRSPVIQDCQMPAYRPLPAHAADVITLERVQIFV